MSAKMQKYENKQSLQFVISCLDDDVYLPNKLVILVQINSIIIFTMKAFQPITANPRLNKAE